MRALTFSDKEGLRLKADHPKPDVAEGEALIKVIRAGICSTVRGIPSAIAFLLVPLLVPLDPHSQQYLTQEAHAPCAHPRHIARSLDLTAMLAGS